ncbi:MAG: hypothetical protein U9R42_13310 [Bacteroidota bacterium]|nr:hypothetical protein [Bacteroidota bacterium]
MKRKFTKTTKSKINYWILPPIFVLLLLFMLSGNNLLAQNKCACNVVPNSEITWDSIPYNGNALITPWWFPIPPNQPFPTLNYFPNWLNTQGNVNTHTTFTSSPSSFELRNYKVRVTVNQQIQFQYLTTGFKQSIKCVEQGKPYIFSIMAKNWSYNLQQQYCDSSGIRVFLANNVPYTPQPLTAANIPTPLGGSQEIISFQDTNHYGQYTVCNFIPNNSWREIWIYTDTINNSMTNKNLCRSHHLIDDIELIRNFDFAGPDEITFCDTNEQFTIGDTCSFINFTATYKWYKLPDTSNILSTNNTITVSPDSITTYVLERTLHPTDCIGYDTVTIKPGQSPIVELPPDTTACSPSFIDITASVDSCNHCPMTWYKWNPKTNKWFNSAYSHDQTIRVTKSGCFKFIACNDACCDSDSICVVIYPEIDTKPDSMTICDTNRCYWFVADSGFVSYTWWLNDTNSNHIGLTRKICENIPGNYIVKVVDTNGCWATDTSKLKLEIPVLDLAGLYTACDRDTIKIVLDYDTGNTYNWYEFDSTSSSFNHISSNRQISITTNGFYKACITDTLGCTACDSFNALFYPLPEITATDIDTCWPAEIIKLNNTNPANCSFYGPDTSVVGNLFLKNIPGTYQILALYTDSNLCTNTDTFDVVIHPPPEAQIIGPTVFCVNDPIYHYDIYPIKYRGGTWNMIFNGNTYSYDSVFNPANPGVGNHEIRYLFTDSNGCIGGDTIFVKVNDTFDVYILDNLNGQNSCITKNVKLTANTTKAGSSYYYSWSTGEDTKSIYVTQKDTYTVYVYNIDSSCIDSAFIYLDFCDCCDINCMAESNVPNEIAGNQHFYWTDTTLFIDHDVEIFDDATLHITNSTIYMRNCSKLIVKSSMSGTSPGHLIIENSEIGICRWKGIEVWGNYDACPDNLVAHGKLEIRNSKLTNADIGIFVGKRDGTIHDRTYAGGIIEVDNDTFSNNYVDIMFSEWSFAGACLQINCSGIWASTITNNYFDTLADQQFCNDYVDVTLNLYDNYYNNIPPKDTNCTSWWTAPFIPQRPPRCHIIDLSPYVDVWIYDDRSLCPLLRCQRSYWFNGGIPPQNNILDNNKYKGERNVADPCFEFAPHKKHYK